MGDYRNGSVLHDLIIVGKVDAVRAMDRNGRLEFYRILRRCGFGSWAQEIAKRLRNAG